MIHNVYMGEVVHNLKSGRTRRFKPAGEVMTFRFSKGKSRNPRVIDAKEAKDVEALPVGGYSARIFIGLNVGTETKYTLEDVMREALRVRKKQGKGADGSFLAQKGIYEDRQGRTIEEPSVQIILIDLTGADDKTWTREMTELAQTLCTKFHQETVILEIQRRGIVEALYSVTP